MQRRAIIVSLSTLAIVFSILVIPPLIDGYRPEPAHGTPLLDWDGVTIYHHSKGHDRRGQFGVEYQCVEFVNRWLAREGHRNLTKTGHALSYFTHATQKGLVPYPNGGTESPMPGDVLVFSSALQPYGHVGIIVDISVDRVRILQQNAPVRVLGGLLMKDRPVLEMPVVRAQEHWTVEAPYPLTAVGWSRLP